MHIQTKLRGKIFLIEFSETEDVFLCCNGQHYRQCLQHNFLKHAKNTAKIAKCFVRIKLIHVKRFHLCQVHIESSITSIQLSL